MESEPNQKIMLESRKHLDRLFMIDVVELSKYELKVILHFVNKTRDPTKPPKIKMLHMEQGPKCQQFIVDLERRVKHCSKYYKGKLTGK